MTLQDFITQHRITLRAERAAENPHMAGFRGDHWKCLLTRTAPGQKNPFREGSDLRPGWHPRASRLTVYFSKGYGHNGAEPTAAEVLDCLASDAAGIENARSFEEWAGEYGYDTDSRKAEKIYKTCRRQAAKLKAFLGEELYNQLLWEVER